MQPTDEAPSRLAAERETDGLQMLPQRWRSSLVRGSDIRQALTKGLARTGQVHTAVAARMQPNTDGNLPDRQVGEDASEATTRTTRAPLTVRTPRGAPGRRQLHGELLLRDGHSVYVEGGQVGEDTRKKGRKQNAL
jgi:hypothetical protein